MIKHQKEIILSKAQEVRDLTKKDGKLWFVFVGHGAPSRDGKDGVLVGMDNFAKCTRSL